jgi:hypothetical protein
MQLQKYYKKISRNNSMEQSPLWKTNNHSYSQEIPYPCMESDGPLWCSQQPASGPCPEPDASSPHICTVSLTSIIIVSPSTPYLFRMFSYLQVIRTKFCMHLSSPCGLHALFFSSSFTLSRCVICRGVHLWDSMMESEYLVLKKWIWININEIRIYHGQNTHVEL